MKKVGIITFHASLNCGSMLQAYALQKVISMEFGLENEIINFSNQAQKEMYSIFVKVKKPRNIIGNFLKFIFYPILRKSQIDFQEFIDKYLIVSGVQFSENAELKEIDGKYDFYICGSDQVWNTSASDFDDAYFLNFVTKGKKIAYSTSLGATNIIENVNSKLHYQKLLSDFSSISVREGNAKSIIENIYDRDIKITLDPTLLLSKENWFSIIDKHEPIVKQKYIFYYAFNYNNQVNKFVMDMGKKYKMPVYIIDARPWGPGLKFRFGFKLSKDFGPLAMMNLMKNATLVFTTSFHGTVFSSLFEKKFWFVNSDMHNENDDRATYLLSQLDLIHRFRTIADLYEINLLDNISFTESQKRIYELRHKSLEYLSDALTL